MSDHGRIYLDNAATSFPKPPGVLEAMTRYATRLGASPGRGAYAESVESAEILTSARQRLCKLINGQSPDHVVFTLNTTDALSLAIKGVARARRLANPGRPVHFVTTAMDHNSVLRPLNALAADAVATWTCVPADPVTGLVDPAGIAGAITPHTALVAVAHASNVSGTLQPIAEIGAACGRAGVPLLVDAAQAVGHTPVDAQAMGVDLLAVPGHKGLLGPLGTGALYISPRAVPLVATTREGGTGSVSELDTHPDTMPDRYEAGSHNTIGIAGLNAGLGWLLDRGVEPLWAHERALIGTMLDRLGDAGSFPGLKLVGPPGPENRVGVFSFTHEALSPGELSAVLESEFGVLSRAGIHCAPRAHQTFGTLGTGGAARISFGPFTTASDVNTAADALSQICRSALAV